MSSETRDEFLDGRLTIVQPKNGYRAGADPVFLAAAIDATAGDRVLELGCGVGVALFCLMHRVPELIATGVELQSNLVSLACRNAKANRLSARLVSADIQDLPADVRAESFDHVLANPPFFDRIAGPGADEPSRETGRGETAPLASWIDVATRRLKPQGQLTLIQRASRLGDVIRAMDHRLGNVIVQPLSSRRGRSAGHIIVTAKKNSRGEMRLMEPLILHEGAKHEGDWDGYSAQAKAILRDGQSLSDAKLVPM
ncbi:MAG: tRNA1(Val) (adenine(37)-N6)-methyltransferase [Boseongicola sp.]